ncbi:hsc70 interacting protein [Trichuris trichiura]|uniref:Hsc70 interacting protein n=1 Tax=Trichuris trichiura TaxID=36087 RepID=A0A077ZK66_TRITR|nr:hsc70 interacting protein [Trichuris trichiura]
MVVARPTNEQVQLLRAFVDLCQKNPELLHIPELQFYRQYLERAEERLPKADEPMEEDEEEGGEEEVESDIGILFAYYFDQLFKDLTCTGFLFVELDNTGVIEPDEGMELPAGDESVEVTEEMLEQSDEKRRAAVEASNKGDLESALKLYTEAICLNPGSALLHAKRAAILVMMKKPVAAIRDCDKAIALNPNVAQPYKYRGWANRLIGRWEEAHHDLCLASKLDCDEEVFQWLKEVEPNVSLFYSPHKSSSITM